MCGDIAYKVMSSVTGVMPVSRQFAAYGGMFGVRPRRRVLPSSAVYSTSLPSARYSERPPLVVANASPA